MPLKPWPRSGSRSIAACRVFNVRADTCRSPRTGVETEFFILEASDWVNVIAYTENDEALLVRQYRFGSEDMSLEIPGGMIDPGEDPQNAAARELLEETGYAAGKIEYLGVVHPNPALQKNRCFTYLATNCRLEGKPHLDTLEDIELVKVPKRQLPELLLNGGITHALVHAAFLHERLRGKA